MADPGFPTILAHGVDGCVVRFADRLDDASNRAAIDLQAALAASPPDGVVETASALASVFLRFDPERVAFEALKQGLLRRLSEHLDTRPTAAGRLWTIPAVFGGPRAPGLVAAADQAGLSADAAIADLTAKPVRVLAIGFAPGQPYLGELAGIWNIPRLPDLIQVPEGALVLAIRQFVLFANPSPTGWAHVAQTAFPVFRPNDPDPFAFRPGDQVQFQSVSDAEFDALEGKPDGGAVCELVT